MSEEPRPVYVRFVHRVPSARLAAFIVILAGLGIWSGIDGNWAGLIVSGVLIGFFAAALAQRR